MFTFYRKSYYKVMITTGILISLVVVQFSFDIFAAEKLSSIKRKFMRQLDMMTSSNSLTVPREDLGNEFMTTDFVGNSTNSSYCSQISPLLLGRITIPKVPRTTIKELESAFTKSGMFQELGGRYKPPGCLANHRIAIIIPFRNREKHLLLFLQHMHPFLQRQQIEYRIFVIEQSGSAPFNRAMLMNIGAVEVLKLTPFECFIFHDVDHLPENDNNIYSCLDKPRHMAVAVNTNRYKLPYKDFFGGVNAMTKEQFFKVNGFSNTFWGWGGEDDDLYRRINHHKLQILRSSPEIARYTMLPHSKAWKNPDRTKLLDNGKVRYSTDGLNSLKYVLIDIQLKISYTHIVVDLLYISNINKTK